MKRKVSIIVTVIVVLSCLILSSCSGETYGELKFRKERLLQRLEDKYGIEFEILGPRSDGIKGTHSFNLRPKGGGAGFSASIYYEGTDKETIGDDYAHHDFASKWDKVYMKKIPKFFNTKTYVLSGNGYLEDEYSYFYDDKVDLEKQNFEYFNTNHIEYFKSFDSKLIMITDIEDDNFDHIYKDLMNYFNFLKENGIEEARMMIFIYDEKALEDPEVIEIIDKLEGGEIYKAGELETKMMSKDYFRYTSGGWVTFYMKDIEKYQDIEKYITFITRK